MVSDAANDPLSIHFMESDDEAALFRGEGSLAAWYGRMGWRCDFLSHGSPARRVADMVPRGRRVLLVHGCRVGEAEYDMVSDRLGQTLWWVLCPRSNDYISGLRPPVELLRQRRGRVYAWGPTLWPRTSASRWWRSLSFSAVYLWRRPWRGLRSTARGRWVSTAGSAP